MDFDFGWFMVLVLFIFVPALLVRALWRSVKLRRQNYDWYRGKYPGLVSPGRVKCYRCDGSDIGTERLMNGAFTRAHLCRTCGANLYYSPERQ